MACSISRGSNPETTMGLCSSFAIHSYGLHPITVETWPGPMKRVQTHVGRIQNGADRRNDRDVIAEHGKIVKPSALARMQRERRRRRRGLKTDGEEHHVLVGIRFGELERVGRRIDDAHIHAACFVFQRTALRAGHAHHVAEGGEDDIRILRRATDRRQCVPSAARTPDIPDRGSVRYSRAECLSGRSDRWHGCGRRKLP